MILPPRTVSPTTGTNWETRVEVPLWAAFMAVRYGMGRRTYANGDASSMARQFWDLFDEGIQQQIRGDAARLTGLEAEEWTWLWPTR